MTAYWGNRGTLDIHSFLTMAVVGGDWSTTRSGRYTSGRNSWYPLDSWLGGPPYPVWTFWRREKFDPSAGIRTPDCLGEGIITGQCFVFEINLKFYIFLTFHREFFQFTE